MVTDEFMIGVDCGHSRHAGLISAEMGASYISFKMPNNQSESESSIIETELFEWWHHTVEISLVAEGCNTLQQMSAVLKVSDFISISPYPESEIEPLVPSFNSVLSIEVV